MLHALRAVLPAEDFIYLGDTARLPYGTKSRASVIRYSMQAAEALIARDIKCLVVACNTASAFALGGLRERCAPLPVVGVVEPGAQAACAASRTGHIVVIGTEGTVQG
ncbi:MAG: glutamate racemase, partial [Steroidobacteraceae bacterium]